MKKNRQKNNIVRILIINLFCRLILYFNNAPNKNPHAPNRHIIKYIGPIITRAGGGFDTPYAAGRKDVNSIIPMMTGIINPDFLMILL